MFVQPVHTYRATLMHMGIEAKAKGPTKHAALSAVVEAWARNRKATAEGRDYCERLTWALLEEWRIESRQYGTPLLMRLERPHARLSLDRI